jgi:hypothetical protein
MRAAFDLEDSWAQLSYNPAMKPWDEDVGRLADTGARDG